MQTRTDIQEGKIDRPIFILAPHRSGTTLLYRILAQHPAIRYLSLSNQRLPGHPIIARLLTRFGVTDKPVEGQRVWDYHWNQADDLMGADDANPRVRDWYRGLVGRILGQYGVNRFIAKYPRLSVRIDWIDAIFPDALYVHIQRDWRAVVNSTLKQRAQRDSKNARWYGMRIPGWEKMSDAPPEVTAGRQYRFATQYLEERAQALGPRLMQVRYEQLCSEPVETLRQVMKHCDLAWSDDFRKALPDEIRNANYKWRERLTPDQIERVRALDAGFFAAHEVGEDRDPE